MIAPPSTPQEAAVAATMAAITKGEDLNAVLARSPRSISSVLLRLARMMRAAQRSQLLSAATTATERHIDGGHSDARGDAENATHHRVGDTGVRDSSSKRDARGGGAAAAPSNSSMGKAPAATTSFSATTAALKRQLYYQRHQQRQWHASGEVGNFGDTMAGNHNTDGNVSILGGSKRQQQQEEEPVMDDDESIYVDVVTVENDDAHNDDVNVVDMLDENHHSLIASIIANANGGNKAAAANGPAERLNTTPGELTTANATTTIALDETSRMDAADTNCGGEASSDASALTERARRAEFAVGQQLLALRDTLTRQALTCVEKERELGARMTTAAVSAVFELEEMLAGDHEMLAEAAASFGVDLAELEREYRTRFFAEYAQQLVSPSPLTPLLGSSSPVFSFTHTPSPTTKTTSSAMNHHHSSANNLYGDAFGEWSSSRPSSRPPPLSPWSAAGSPAMLFTPPAAAPPLSSSSASAGSSSSAAAAAASSSFFFPPAAALSTTPAAWRMMSPASFLAAAHPQRELSLNHNDIVKASMAAAAAMPLSPHLLACENSPLWQRRQSAPNTPTPTATMPAATTAFNYNNNQQHHNNTNNNSLLS